jgi:hypothetical protein
MKGMTYIVEELAYTPKTLSGQMVFYLISDRYR